MIINNIDFTSFDNVYNSNFSFRDINSENPYNVIDITGLDAEEIIPQFYGFSEIDSSKYYSLSLKKRQIVINITLNPNLVFNQTMDSLRNNLYRTITASRVGLVKLLFKDNDAIISQISGFVTKFESMLFIKSPEVKITIDCDDPIFKSNELVDVDTGSFGILPTVLDEISTAPHGFEFGLTFTNDYDIFLMHDQVASGWRFQIIFNFLAGDELRFSSKTNDKYFYVIRSGINIHLIDKLLINTIWPILFPGNNVFYLSTGVFTWDYLRHYYSYWGV